MVCRDAGHAIVALPAGGELASSGSVVDGEDKTIEVAFVRVAVEHLVYDLTAWPRSVPGLWAVEPAIIMKLCYRSDHT